MNQTTAKQVRNNDTNLAAGVATVDMKLEAIVVPVSDAERAEQFYRKLGWRQDVTPPGSGVFQFTPHGSACSVQFGKGLTSAAPGSVQRTYLIVSDIEATRMALVEAGINVSEIFHFGPDGPANGPDPGHRTYSSFATFSDPDGNSWLLQEVKTRLPGRGFTSMDVATLTELLRETEERHGEYEASAPKHHWSGWYAAYIVARERGRTSEEAAKDAALHMEALISA